MQVESLASATATRDYYESRYRQGYMDRWEAERGQRLRDVLRHIDLPAGARILDYGSGSGALTRVLAEHWPQATVVGADISRTAVANARQRHGQRADSAPIDFAVLDAAFLAAHAATFDLVFSHHVLEHVFDLPAAVQDLASLLSANGRMLHVLPCGNPGSLPHWLCKQRPDGIDAAVGNRFYFEEASHLRRLQSAELAEHFAAHGWRVQRAAFGYHRIGAIRLFTEMAPSDLWALLHPLRCHRQRLPHFLALLLSYGALAAARAPIQVLVRTRRLLQQVFRFRTRRLCQPTSICLLLLAIPSLCLLPLAVPVEALMRWGDRREWRTRRGDPRGSEMLLEFARTPELAPEAATTAVDAGKAAAGFTQCSATLS